MGMWLRAAMCAVVLACLPVTAAAASEVTASLQVRGGSLSVATGSVVLTPDSSATDSASGTSRWTAVDARGTGDGWHLTVSVDAIVADGIPIGASGDEGLLEIQLLDHDVHVVAGNNTPTSRVTSPTPIPATGTGSIRFLSASADQGMGTFVLFPGFTLTTPAGSTATTYSAILTVDIATGP